MIDCYGRWTEEKGYSAYPKEKWCDYDRMVMWIRNNGYKPKTSMRNLIDMIFLYCDSPDMEGDENYDFSNLDDVKAYVEDSGGLKEFDCEVV